MSRAAVISILRAEAGLNVGHNHPAVVSAITRQLNEFTGDCFRVAASPAYIRLACRLNQLVGDGEAFQTVFFNSGADAVVQAINSARAFTGRHGIITFEGAAHGHSLADFRLTSHSPPGQARAEERRVGEEGRSRWWPAS